MTKTYSIIMRTLKFMSDEDALSYYPTSGNSNLTLDEARARAQYLNSVANSNGWAVEYQFVIN